MSKMNKKADIPVTILVMLTIALCMFSLVVFYLADKQIEGNIKGYDFLEKIYSDFDNQKFSGEEETIVNEENYKKQVGISLFRKKVFEYSVQYIP
jgi:hypothetical protein